MDKKKSFTLAEVLITIAIIGVVAALTIPTVVENYREKQMTTALKKFYSDASKVYQSAKLNKIDIEYAGINSTLTLYEYFRPYLKVVKDCGFEDTSCFYDGNYASLGPNFGKLNTTTRYNVVLADGVSVSFLRDNNANGSVFGEIDIDLNGPTGPNRFGFDTFFFGITNKGFIPGGMKTGYSNYDYNMSQMASRCRLGYNNGNNGRGCAAWVLIKGNMDYLKKSVDW